MLSNSIYLPLLLSGTFGLVENLYIQLQDCCKYKDQGIIFIVDRDNGDYKQLKEEKFEKISATQLILQQVLESGRGSIVVVSKSVLAGLLGFFERRANPISFPYLDWNIKELDDFYVLTYIGKDLSNIDIKLSSLPSSSFAKVRNYDLEPENTAPIIDIFSKLFITLPEKLKDVSGKPITSWMIYLAGHGFVKSRIGGLSIKEFKTVIDYFENKIKTKIFIYNSCYSGGVNKNIAFEKDPSMDLQKRYGELKAERSQIDNEINELERQLEKPNVPAQEIKTLDTRYSEAIDKFNLKGRELNKIVNLLNSSSNSEPIAQKNYSFPIIVTSSADAPTSISVKFPLLFDKIFDALSANKSQNYYDILSSGNVFVSSLATTSNPEVWISNIPQIRLPGLDTFSMDLLKSGQDTKDFVVISKTQAKTRERELKIKETAKSIFLYSAYVPFALIFQARFNSSVRFVYMDSSDAYRFQEINATNMSFIDICKIFAPISDKQNVTLFIDKLIFKEENQDKKNEFNNAVFKMTIDASGKKLEFNLSSGEIQFSAETDKNKLDETTINVENYRKTFLKVPQVFNISEALKLEPVREKLKSALSKAPGIVAIKG